MIICKEINRCLSSFVPISILNIAVSFEHFSFQSRYNYSNRSNITKKFKIINNDETQKILFEEIKWQICCYSAMPKGTKRYKYDQRIKLLHLKRVFAKELLWWTWLKIDREYSEQKNAKEIR